MIGAAIARPYIGQNPKTQSDRWRMSRCPRDSGWWLRLLFYGQETIPSWRREPPIFWHSEVPV